jgi:hypothetical protein
MCSFQFLADLFGIGHPLRFFPDEPGQPSKTRPRDSLALAKQTQPDDVKPLTVLHFAVFRLPGVIANESTCYQHCVT